MANEKTSEDVQTVPMAEYKTLQRKLDRASKKAAKAEERAEALESGQGRTEDMIESLMTLVTEGDPEAAAKATDLINTNSSRRTADVSAAQLTARLNQTIDDADEDWEDAKFDSARAVLDDINKSGDMGRGYEAERLIKDAIASTSSTDDIEERMKRAAADAVLKDRQEHGRVDTAESVSTGDRLRYSDIAQMDPSTGVEAMRAITKKALDQMFEAG